MKVSYKGFDIEVVREKSLGGWDNIYYTIYRQSDLLEVVCNFRDGSDNVKSVMREMKDIIDDPELLKELIDDF